MRERAARNVLQPRLVVHDHIIIIADILVQLGLQHAVDKAIAALALRAAHDYDFKKLTEKLLDVIEHPVTDGKED